MKRKTVYVGYSEGQHWLSGNTAGGEGNTEIAIWQWWLWLAYCWLDRKVVAPWLRDLDNAAYERYEAERGE